MNTSDLRARRLLEAVEEARSQVARLQCSVRELEARSANLTARYDLHLGTVSGGTGPEGRWASLADQRDQLFRQQKQLAILMQTVEQWINLLPKPRWRMVLRYRYLEGLDLPGTCQALSQAAGFSFSMSQIYRLHRQALLAAERLWPFPRSQDTGPVANVLTGSGLFPGIPAVTEPRKAATDAGPDCRT